MENLCQKALIPRKQVFEFIEDSLKQTLSNDLEQAAFSNKIKTNIYNTSFDDSDTIKDHMTWVRHNSFLKMIPYNVPQNIVNNQNDSILYDIKVQSRGPDDLVFDKNADIRAKIARGNTILERKLANGKTDYDLIVYALRKFSGGMGDEDDVDRGKNDWKNYFLKDVDQTEYVVSLQKANGEAAHMSCRFINDQFLICAGSKNVHLLFKKKEDLFEYKEERFTYCKIIAEAVLSHLQKMNPEIRKMFLSFLCWTRFTVIFELLNPNTQHVEDLSYLNEPLLKFITFTDNKLDEKPTTLCCLPPELSIQIGKLFEFSCVQCTKLKYPDVEDHLVKIRKDYGYEGVVLYFLDSDYNVIGLLKKKTTWYIVIRAVREKVRRHLNSKNKETLKNLKDRISSRLKNIKRWIGFSEDDLIKWTDLACKFAEWFDTAYQSNKISLEDSNTRFPVVWNKFLAESKLTDRIELTIQTNSE